LLTELCRGSPMWIRLSFGNVSNLAGDSDGDYW